VLRHRPGPREGKKLHAYAIAKFTDGGHAYVVLPWSHVMKIRDGSQGWQQAVRSGKTDEAPWKKHEDEMAKKTAIRARAKYLPMSVEMVDAMTVDEKTANYRAFAMDPTQGVAPVEEDFIEGEAEETDAPAQIEADTAPDPVQEQMKKAQPEKQAAKPATKPKETAPAKREEPKPAAATEDDQFRGLLRMMLADLEQSGPDETLSVYGPQIEAMKASAPGIFAEWQKALIAARKAQESAAPEDAAEPAQDAGPDPYGTPLGKTFLKDCADMGFDAAMDFHDAAMDALQGANPALWRAIMDEAKRIDPMAQGD
jgi:recombination protein RecT